MAPEREEEEEKGAGLIDLDMSAFGSGSMSDPLRHAVGMRTAQDECKMRQWNSWPTIFQNTIFHGEQDAEIKALRQGGSFQARLGRGRELKDAGNQALRAASRTPVVEQRPTDDSRRAEVEAREQRVRDLEAIV